MQTDRMFHSVAHHTLVEMFVGSCRNRLGCMGWPDHSRLDCRTPHIAITSLESACYISKQSYCQTMAGEQTVEHLLAKPSKRATYGHIWEDPWGILCSISGVTSVTRQTKTKGFERRGLLGLTGCRI